MLWKAVIVAWIMSADMPPRFLTMERHGVFLTEAACEAKQVADAFKIEAELHDMAADRSGELLSHVVACVEDEGGQVA